ncbi:MAG: polysaccharide deacetylase family protein [Anaerolineae bacterium]|nr:polysaccharide deacetylase family protein [Anaerolineae bacterium]
MREKLLKGLQESPNEARRLLTQRYPPFVTALRPKPTCDEIPVFMFHTVHRPNFAAQLAYLKANGYQTATLSQFMAFLQGTWQPAQPTVLLTFDDGDISWYDTALPLLEQYSFTATGFVVPNYIKAEPQRRTGAKTWLSWPELRAMERSGVFDIQSHSHYHAQVFIRPKRIDFYHPGFDANPLGLDIPWLNDDTQFTNKLRWGTPIYMYAPQLAGQPRYCDDQHVRQACVAYVNDNGGIHFFEQPDWRETLTTVFKSAQRASQPTFAPESETRALISVNLARSKSILEEKLDKPITHLCYPYGTGSDMAVQISSELGYESNFWVEVPGRRTNRPNQSPFFISRLKDDYLMRLPGTGRHSLSSVFMRKLKRRAQALDTY